MKKFAPILALLVIMALAVTALAADPVISIDFADGAGDVELVNADIVNDVTRGNVLKINGQGNGTARTSYGLYTTDVFENTDWSDGLTISMWIQTDVGADSLSGTAPIYSLDIARIGYIAATCSLETTMNTDGNEPDTGIAPRCWNDPANVSGGMNKTDEGIWQLLTVVYDPDNGIKIYVDGEFYADSPLGGGGMIEFLVEAEFVTAIRLGAWNCDWWNFGDYQGMIDDVNVWNTSLSEDDIYDLYKDTKVTQTVVVKAPTIEELYTAEDHTPVYTLDFEDASALELNNADLVSGRSGNALKVKGEGDGTNGTSYGLVTTDLFKNTDWTNGLTISMWVNADDSDTLNGMAPLYSLDIGRIGYIGVVNSLQSGINTDGNEDVGIVPRFWNDPGNQGECVNETTAGQWDLVTVVYNNDGANNMAIYKNGEAVVKPGMNLADAFGPGTPEQFFTEQLKEVYSLRLGSWLCDWWNRGDYQGLIDDVEIYNVALNPLEVKYLFTGKPADEESAEEAPAAASYPASGESGSIISGSVIGYENGWGDNPDAGRDAAFDGDAATFYDPMGVGDGYVGVDAGESYILDKVAILSRDGFADRFKGAEIRGSNEDDVENAVTLWKSDAEAASTTEYTVITEFENNTGYRYYFYYNTENHGDVAEVEFYGHASADEETADAPVVEDITTDIALEEKMEDKAAQTFDIGVIALVVSALTAGAALSFKKRK